jgi:hypothetical protein
MHGCREGGGGCQTGVPRIDFDSGQPCDHTVTQLWSLEIDVLYEKRCTAFNYILSTKTTKIMNWRFRLYTLYFHVRTVVANTQPSR